MKKTSLILGALLLAAGLTGCGDKKEAAPAEKTGGFAGTGSFKGGGRTESGRRCSAGGCGNGRKQRSGAERSHGGSL